MTAEAPRRMGRPPSLTNEDIEAIRNDAANGEPQVAIAADYGVSPSLISMICRGLRYADAPGPITYRYAPPSEPGEPQ